MTLRKTGWFEFILIPLMLCGAVLSLPAIRSQVPETVVIYHDNRVVSEYPLGEARIVPVHGSEGKMEIMIADKEVSVRSATCRNQICVHSGPIAHPAAHIVCAPNRIMVHIKGSQGKNSIDAIAR